VLRAKRCSWKRSSAIGALSYQRWGIARVFLMLKRGEVRAPDVRRFLMHLLRHIAGRIVVLWDGLQAHRAKLVNEWLAHNPRLRVVRLPAYAPELNPVEGLWAWTKNTGLANVCEERLEPLERRVRTRVRAVRRAPTLLWGFLHKTGIYL
jgi:transposase